MCKLNEKVERPKLQLHPKVRFPREDRYCNSSRIARRIKSKTFDPLKLFFAHLHCFVWDSSKQRWGYIAFHGGAYKISYIVYNITTYQHAPDHPYGYGNRSLDVMADRYDGYAAAAAAAAEVCGSVAAGKKFRRFERFRTFSNVLGVFDRFRTFLNAFERF